MKQRNLNKIIELRHRLHENPELSLQEHWTKEALMCFIKEHTKLEIVDRGQWFYAVYHCVKPQDKALAFRADFDALPITEGIPLPHASQNPGVSHKCGHDGHSAALAGLALELEELGACRDIYLIFQHAEEIGAGGEACASLIQEKGISRVFAFHNMSGIPEGSIMVRNGITQCASKGLTIRMEGTPAHASQPEDGRNPAKAIAKLVLYTEAMLSGDGSDGGCEGMVLATIVQVAVGNKNFGISAFEGEVSMTLRACYERDMEKLEKVILSYAEKLAQEEHLGLTFSESDAFPETVNDKESADMVRRAAIANGMNVIPMEEPFRASEDFGYYLKQCPGAMLYIGNGEAYPELHTQEYDFNDRILETAVELFKRLIETSD